MGRKAFSDINIQEPRLFRWKINILECIKGGEDDVLEIILKDQPNASLFEPNIYYFNDVPLGWLT